MSVSADGMLLCTTADDKSLKVFDVLNFGRHQLMFPAFILYSSLSLNFNMPHVHGVWGWGCF